MQCVLIVAVGEGGLFCVSCLQRNRFPAFMFFNSSGYGTGSIVCLMLKLLNDSIVWLKIPEFDQRFWHLFNPNRITVQEKVPKSLVSMPFIHDPFRAL